MILASYFSCFFFVVCAGKYRGHYQSRQGGMGEWSSEREKRNWSLYLNAPFWLSFWWPWQAERCLLVVYESSCTTHVLTSCSLSREKGGNCQTISDGLSSPGRATPFPFTLLTPSKTWKAACWSQVRSFLLPCLASFGKSYILKSRSHFPLNRLMLFTRVFCAGSTA